MCVRQIISVSRQTFPYAQFNDKLYVQYKSQYLKKTYFAAL